MNRDSIVVLLLVVTVCIAFSDNIFALGRSWPTGGRPMRDWNTQHSYDTPAQQQIDLDRAVRQWLLNKGLVPGDSRTFVHADAIFNCTAIGSAAEGSSGDSTQTSKNASGVRVHCTNASDGSTVVFPNGEDRSGTDKDHFGPPKIGR